MIDGLTNHGSEEAERAELLEDSIRHHQRPGGTDLDVEEIEELFEEEEEEDPGREMRLVVHLVDWGNEPKTRRLEYGVRRFDGLELIEEWKAPPYYDVAHPKRLSVQTLDDEVLAFRYEDIVALELLTPDAEEEDEDEADTLCACFSHSKKGDTVYIDARGKPHLMFKTPSGCVMCLKGPTRLPTSSKEDE